MLILFTVLVVLSAAAALAIFAKRRNPDLPEQNPPNDLDAPRYRPLFAPTEDELRAARRDENAGIEAKKAVEARRILVAKAEKASDFEKAWNSAPDRKSTIELLFLAAASENAETFGEIAEKVIKLWRENRIENLTAPDLADLLDSHFRILPQQERTSAALFRLKEEIRRLRAGVRGN